MARKKTVKSETTDLAQPQNRTEEFLAKIAGLVDTLPQGEFSRLERYLKYIAENGGGGGGVTSFNTRTGAVTPESGDYSSFYAPSGYGLGIKANTLTAISDTESIEETGWYLAVNGTTAHLPLAVAGIIRAEAYSANNVALTFYYNDGANSAICLRRKISGTWGAWEWVNPTLIAGTEYRTTERFDGKPVYVKALEGKVIIVNGQTQWAHGIANFGTLIRVEGYCWLGSGNSFLLGCIEGLYEMNAGSTNLNIKTDSSFRADMLGYPVIYYTKSA